MKSIVLVRSFIFSPPSSHLTLTQTSAEWIQTPTPSAIQLNSIHTRARSSHSPAELLKSEQPWKNRVGFCSHSSSPSIVMSLFSPLSTSPAALLSPPTLDVSPRVAVIEADLPTIARIEPRYIILTFGGFAAAEYIVGPGRAGNWYHSNLYLRASSLTMSV